MTRKYQTFVMAAGCLAFAVCAAAAQQQQPQSSPPPSAAAAPPAKDASVTLKVQVVVSRRQGEKLIGRQPYTITVSPDNPAATLRMGLQVPVTSTSENGKIAFNYRDVGMSIDCSARTLGDGKYRLTLSMDDASVVSDDSAASARAPAPGGVPQFRSFRLSNQIAVLRDGQTAQLTSATEKGTGEIVTVDVTLNVVK